eukprot:1143650-Pelagomonas_calceolata.AAC.4
MDFQTCTKWPALRDLTCPTSSHHAAMSDFAGGNRGACRWGALIGTDVGAGGTSASLPLLHAAAHNLT